MSNRQDRIKELRNKSDLIKSEQLELTLLKLGYKITEISDIIEILKINTIEQNVNTNTGEIGVLQAASDAQTASLVVTDSTVAGVRSDLDALLVKVNPTAMRQVKGAITILAKQVAGTSTPQEDQDLIDVLASW